MLDKLLSELAEAIATAFANAVLQFVQQQVNTPHTAVEAEADPTIEKEADDEIDAYAKSAR